MSPAKSGDDFGVNSFYTSLRLQGQPKPFFRFRDLGFTDTLCAGYMLYILSRGNPREPSQYPCIQE